jgi:hypothetical protein
MRSEYQEVSKNERLTNGSNERAALGTAADIATTIIGSGIIMKVNETSGVDARRSDSPGFVGGRKNSCDGQSSDKNTGETEEHCEVSERRLEVVSRE